MSVSDGKSKSAGDGKNMARKEWNAAIVRALREKGFTKKGARKTAKATIRRSIQARDRKESNDPRNGKVRVIVKNGVRLIPE